MSHHLQSISEFNADRLLLCCCSSRSPDPDPDGVKLAAADNPLQEATKYVVMLTSAAPNHLESQLAAAEVYRRKGRTLLEAAAAKRARNIAGPDHPDVHRAIVQFAQRGKGRIYGLVTQAGDFAGPQCSVQLHALH